ncbi:MULTISPECIES: hypothetical protein [unclassified Bradyrhizobium]
MKPLLPWMIVDGGGIRTAAVVIEAVRENARMAFFLRGTAIADAAG